MIMLEKQKEYLDTVRHCRGSVNVEKKIKYSFKKLNSVIDPVIQFAKLLITNEGSAINRIV